MGLLKDFGKILDFEDADKMQLLLRKIGIRQFLKVLEKYRNWKKTTNEEKIKWGE